MSEAKKKKNIWNAIGLFTGIMLIIIGIIFLFEFKDASFYGYMVHLGSASFGADFYTSIYESTTFAANALKGIYEMVNIYLSTLLIFIGIIDICFFGNKLSRR